MKKLLVLVGMVFLAMPVFSIFETPFELLNSGEPVRIKVGDTELDYIFARTDLSDPVGSLLLGMEFGRDFYDFLPSLTPEDVIRDNTSLAPAVKDKMRELGANVCVTVAGSRQQVIVNIHNNGKYTTLVMSNY
jgi:hypothetical protein